jgi:LysM repeat protein
MMKKRLAFSILLVTALVFGSFGFSFGANSYTVQAGDVLWKIAEQYNISYQDLAKYNQIKNPDLIYVNQIIKIPDKTPAEPPKPAEPAIDTPASAEPETAADTILKNGTIYTIDDKNTKAEAVAVKDGKNPLCGKLFRSLTSTTDSSSKVVDIERQRRHARIVDAHVHAPGTALTE